MRKLLFIHLLIAMTSMSFAKNKVETFNTDDCDIRVMNIQSDNSIVDILESDDSANPGTDCFEIAITSNTGEPALRCVIGADILKTFYTKKKLNYSNASKSRKYGTIIKDLLRESKLARVDANAPVVKNKTGKEQ